MHANSDHALVSCEPRIKTQHPRIVARAQVVSFHNRTHQTADPAADRLWPAGVHVPHTSLLKSIPSDIPVRGMDPDVCRGHAIHVVRQSPWPVPSSRRPSGSGFRSSDISRQAPRAPTYSKFLPFSYSPSSPCCAPRGESVLAAGRRFVPRGTRLGKCSSLFNSAAFTSYFPR